MRQRNDTGQAMTVHTDPPRLLEPGDEIDHDSYVVGLTVLDPPAVDADGPGDAPTDKPAGRAARTAKEATR